MLNKLLLPNLGQLFKCFRHNWRNNLIKPKYFPHKWRMNSFHNEFKVVVENTPCQRLISKQHYASHLQASAKLR